MAKIDSTFPHDVYKFIHKPIRDEDKKNADLFLERFLVGVQNTFEDTQAKINTIMELIDPAKTRVDLLQYLKAHVGFTAELDNITKDLAENDLRKLISLAVALWKQKGTETGYENVIRLFTGKSARIFNWFDFRMIVGEVAFGEEQLGEDAWLISLSGVELTQDTANTVISLYTFEGDAKDRSLTSNDGIPHGSINYFNTPPTGFPGNSTKYIDFNGGMIEIKHTAVYDFSDKISIEIWLRPDAGGGLGYVFSKMDGSGVGIQLSVNPSTNTVSFHIDDGATDTVENFVPAADIDDGTLYHFAFVVDITDAKARMWFDGEGSTEVDISGTGDLTNIADMMIGSDSVGGGTNYLGDMDNLRVSTNEVYPTATDPIVPPIVGFIEFIAEELDEFFTDIRVVDEGDVNKNLVLRILNLMRPVSERLRVIFISFFEDFISGSGRFDTITGVNSVDSNQEWVLQENSLVATNVLNASEFKDIVLQSKITDKTVGGGISSVIFFYQDANNFYELRIDQSAKTITLYKRVATVDSIIGAAVDVDIVPGASYIFTVITGWNALNSNTVLQTYMDSNTLHNVIDASFEKGKFGYKIGAGTTVNIGEIEMFQYPMDIQFVLPGFSL